MLQGFNADLWLASGLFEDNPVTTFLAAAFVIPFQLDAICNVATVKTPAVPSGTISQDTENALKLETLAQITKSPNTSTREAAISILKDRLLASHHDWMELLAELAGPERVGRGKSLSIIHFILSEISTLDLLPSRLQQPLFHRAMVECLRNLLPGLIASARESKFPEQSQIYALEIVDQILDHTAERPIQAWVEADLIEDWLQFVPFQKHAPFSIVQCPSIADSVRCVMNEDQLPPWIPESLSSILKRLLLDPLGREQCVEAGLWSQDFDSDLWPVYDDDEVVVVEGFHGENLRRQRREAIVIGEEGRPIESRDIIQQGGGLHDVDTELLDRLRDEISAGGAQNQQSDETTTVAGSLFRWMQRSLPPS